MRTLPKKLKIMKSHFQNMSATPQAIKEREDIDSADELYQNNMNSNTMFDLSTLLNSTWGPTEDAIPTIDASLPFVPYAKGDPICYIADWDPNHKQHKTRHGQSKFLGAQNITQLGVFSDEDAESYTSECSNHDFITVLRHDYDRDKRPWKSM